MNFFFSKHPKDARDLCRRVNREDFRLECSTALLNRLKALGWTRQHLAERMEVTPGAITQKLAGCENLQSDSLADLATVMNARWEMRLVDDEADEDRFFPTCTMTVKESSSAQFPPFGSWEGDETPTPPLQSRITLPQG